MAASIAHFVLNRRRALDLRSNKYFRKVIGGLSVTIYNETSTFSDEEIWQAIKFVMKGLKVHWRKEPSNLKIEELDGVSYPSLYRMGPREIAVVVRDCYCSFLSPYGGRYVRPPPGRYWLEFHDGISFNGIVVVNATAFDEKNFPKFMEGFKRTQREEEDEYLDKLLLNRKEELIPILAHEFRHIWQDDIYWQYDKITKLVEEDKHKTQEIFKPRKSMIWRAKTFFSERDADSYTLRKVREWRRFYNNQPRYETMLAELEEVRDA